MRQRGSATRRVFRIRFRSEGQLYEVYARSVTQGSMFGFVEIEGILFGERTSVVVDPSEERLKTEFAGVRRVLVPLQAVVRIDEVEKEGAGRIVPGGGSEAVVPFPSPALTSPPAPKKR